MRLSILISALLVSGIASATTVTGAKALGLLESLRLMGVMSDGTADERNYKHDFKCTRFYPVDIPVGELAYGFPSYRCEFGDFKMSGSRAKLLFEGASQTLGARVDAGQTITTATNLDCRIRLKEADLDKRFSCSFD